LDDDGSCGGGGEACGVGDDVVDGVGCGLGGVDMDRVCLNAVDVGRDAEVEVGWRAGDGRAEVSVAIAHVDVRGVVAVDLVVWALFYAGDTLKVSFLIPW